MSVYMTEEEQIDAIKKWWKKYSFIIITVFSIALLIIAGLRYWNWRHENTKLLASNTYENLMLSFSNQESKKVQSYANKLINDFKHTIYADIAHLTLAKQFIDNGDILKGKSELNQVIQKGNIHSSRQMANIRLARVLLSEKEYDQALKQLNDMKYDAFEPMVNELKGDIYAATGHHLEAYSSYKKAISATQAQGMGNLFLELKTNELASVNQSVKMKSSQTETA